MLTANNLDVTSIMTQDLMEEVLKIANQRGSLETRVEYAKFLGITNGGEFCYSVKHQPTNSDESLVSKIFLRDDKLLKIIVPNFGK